ncbi:hypothetical protein HTY53_17055 [Cupriavidus gilardii]|nr:hypothetical protein [Cupriavidus gilardii]
MERYLTERRLPTSQRLWRLEIALVGDLTGEPGIGIASTRLWLAMK